MAYQLHIEKKDGAIALQDWKEVVARVDGVRLCESVHTIRNPASGDVISSPLRDGDAEIFYPDISEWQAAFSWFKGRISFRAKPIPNPVWEKAASLALHLDGVIRGDAGEVYDLQSGKVVS